MRNSLRIKIVLIILAVYLLCGLLMYLFPKLMDSPLGIIMIAPYILAVVLHNIGIPYMLEHNGACGWGWCAPTWAGWALSGAICFAVLWLLAGMIVKLQETPKP